MNLNPKVNWHLFNSRFKRQILGEITKKTGIKYTPHEDFTFQNILVQRMIKHLFDFEMEYITYIIGIRRMD